MSGVAATIASFVLRSFSSRLGHGGQEMER
jgi:hypothetical protein